MIVSVIKNNFQKLKPRIIIQYRDYTQLSNAGIRKKPLENLSLENINTSSNDRENFCKFLSVHLAKCNQAKQYIRGNSMLFLNKELSGAHQKRMQLINRYLKKRSYQSKKFYTKEWNFYV